ncbi:MAG: hypothetical protein OXH57_11025 [Ekhidna sp.]|nr:hypothetical protein [Ekhidna sp.]
MEVIIVAKTHMPSAACVGGVLSDGRSVRLLSAKGHQQSAKTKLKVGDVYTITFSEREKKPPHVEDILINSAEYKFSFLTITKMVEHLKEELKVKIWRGSVEILFDNKLRWTREGTGFISRRGELPNSSVGFWIPDRDLT